MTAAARRSRSCSVSSASNDEFGTTSGLMSSAASARSGASRPPAIKPARRVRVSATSVSSNCVRNRESSTRADSVRTIAHRPGSRPPSVAFPSSPRSGDRGLEQRRALLVRQLGGEGGVDPGDPSLERLLLFGRDGGGVLGREVVLGIDRVPGGDPFRLGPGGALEFDRLGRDDVTRREVARGQRQRLLGQDVGAHDRCEDSDQDPRRDHEARRVAAREAREGVESLGQHRVAPRSFMAGPSVRPDIVAGEIGLRERGRHHAAHDLAVRPAAGSRREPAHDLAEVTRRGRARSRRSPSSTSARSSASLRASGR